MFDNTETDSLELLRFYPSLTAVDGFEDALHERVRQIGRIPDHAFPLIVAVERLEGDGALALVSTHTPGKRLSTFFDKPAPRRGLNPAFVTGIVTQVTKALAVLQSKGDDLAHSAITPDRLVVTTGGRIAVVEHVLGLALRRLNLSPMQLWREFGLVSAPTATGAISLDARTDVYQLGVLALEMLIGRRLTPQDLKDRLPDLLDQWSEAMARAGLASDRLRYWLERALQLRTSSYANAGDAYADLREVPSESAASAFDSLTGDFETPLKRSLQPAKQAAGQEAPMANAPAPDDLPLIPGPQPLRPSLISSERVAGESRRLDAFAPEAKFAPETKPTAPPVPGVSAAPRAAASTAVPKPSAQTTAPAARTATPRTMMFKVPGISPWITAALAVIALVEGGVIVALLTRQPQAATTAANTPAQAAPAPAPEPAASTPVTTAPPVNTADAKPEAPQPPDLTRAAAQQRSGGVRLVTPIELKVLLGDRVLGSTADGPIIHTAGTHQLDLVNTVLGFRTRMPVTFRPGVIGSVNVTVPPGRLSVNAQPWAEVFLDGKQVGETPLANLSVPVGEHEVIFRHPNYQGERRQTITVRADQPARVSTSFDK